MTKDEIRALLDEYHWAKMHERNAEFIDSSSGRQAQIDEARRDQFAIVEKVAALIARD